MGAALSGSFPSTWNSRWPRGRCTALGSAPCSYSSGSRTSRKVTPPPSSRACASAWSTSRMDLLASFSRSRGVGTIEPPGRTSPLYGWRQRVKHYQRGQHSRGGRDPAGAAPAVGDCRSMELQEVIRRRSMVRSFSVEPVAPEVVDGLLQAALRAPTAGNSAGTSWVVLEGATETGVYFDATTDERWRADHPDWNEGLRRAPVVLLAYTSPGTYVSRYSEADKASSGLGSGEDAWPVPYWYGDAAFGVMTVLLAAVDAGLGSCVL